ncbi:peroxisome biogenesis protein 22 [Phtheirospermum japonicum]|uniref:Peroxisome biogenesis protein 22 n=1 Tax=Phtheirospermum japonicum TaxID=374723 RepID=A0A830C7I5_9LAMI|nr:peroxisome biogenesis protein 22 [Phtheirospermum japonicum]
MVPPRDVANEFVRQYYMILNKCPENAHMFYTESSLLGWQENDGFITPVTTLSAINNKILSSDYKNCFAEVNNVDAQASHDGGVFVAVSGSFIEKDQVTCIFFQTFLGRQERGFFVLNDILRAFNAYRLAAAEAELTLVQAIVDSAGFIIQNPELTICYDERGAKYELPKYVLSEPQIRFMTIERGRAFAEEGTVYPYGGSSCDEQGYEVTCRLLGVILEESSPEELQKQATVRSSVLEVLLEITKFSDLYLMERVMKAKSTFRFFSVAQRLDEHLLSDNWNRLAHRLKS